MSSRDRFVSLIELILTLTVSAVPVCHAQWGGINAEFSGGGARALAMGGAFIGLADDATAVEFNPAGLWQLRRPELAMQWIYTEDEQQTVVFESLSLRTLHRTERGDYGIPSFASFVYPTQYWVLGLSEFTNVYYERSYLHPFRHTSQQEQAKNYSLGLTVATGVTDRLSVGTTLRYNLFRYVFDGSG